MRMRRRTGNLLLLLPALLLAACVNDATQRKQEIQKFQQTATGEFVNDAGDRIVMVPVYARMIGMDTMYLERTSKNGTTQRLLVLEPSGDGEKVMQLSYVFTQPAQWRNLLEHPELLSSLQPNDVRPAGTCNIVLAEDMNSVSYACGNNPPQTYNRVQHEVPE
jgi:hypothetical protein